MTSFLVDSNIMIATLQPRHSHRDGALAAVERRWGRGEIMVVAAHALAEAYSVLTRMPGDRRIAASEAMGLIRSNFSDKATLIALDAAEYLGTLSAAAGRGVAGGRIYDALIARCAEVAGVDVVLTLNRRHFAGLLQGIAIEVPGEAAS